jgi:hypothetical protein
MQDEAMLFVSRPAGSPHPHSRGIASYALTIATERPRVGQRGPDPYSASVLVLRQRDQQVFIAEKELTRPMVEL